MTGPEHYVKAEEYLRQINETTTRYDHNVPVVVALAQVHATLAGAAASASRATIGTGLLEWQRVLSER